MTRGVRLYLVGSFVLVSLAGCGRGFFSEEREPWRAEAEIACLKSGAVKESADWCGSTRFRARAFAARIFRSRSRALGESSGTFGFADDDLRPPGGIGNQPRWPIGQPGSLPAQPQTPYYPDNGQRAPGYGAPPGGPISLSAPGVVRTKTKSICRREGTPGRNPPAQGPYSPQQTFPSRDATP